MRLQGQVLLGIVIVIAGVVFLLGAVLQFDVGDFCLPTVLILAGIWILLRPRMIAPDSAFRFSFFGPVRREGLWQVRDEEIWILLGDVRLDFTQAQLPAEATRIRVFGLIVNLRATVPEGVGVRVSATGLIASARLFDQRGDSFVVPVDLTSDGYGEAESQIELETVALIADARVR